MELRVLVAIAVVVVHGVAGETPHTRKPKNTFYRIYKCVGGHHCRRTDGPISAIDEDVLRSKNEHTTLASCRLVCGNTAGLWPIPTGFTNYSKNYVRIDPLRIYFDTEDLPTALAPFLSEISAIFFSNLELTCGPRCETTNSSATTIQITLRSDNVELDWSTDESYKLSIVTKEDKVIATILATTIYGARHALETLSQMAAVVVTPNGGRGLVLLNQANIHDSPIYYHRGLLIDTARNFLTITDILRTIDAMASTKMNVLHWHATDSQSFPLQIKSRPAMLAYGAYSSEMVYSLEDLGRVVLYAKFRGIRVILELDSPSHVGAGWEWGPSEKLGEIAVCVNRQPWRDYCIQPPCGQLNPINSNTYDVLRDIYRDVLDVMGSRSVLHLGGDEVFINCWNSTPEITNYMKSHGMGRTNDDFLKLWGDFHKRQAEILDAVRNSNDYSTILWSSALTSPDVIERHLDKKRFVVQTWVEGTSPMPEELLKLGYRLIMSTKNTWYLDHGFWGKTQYHSWREAYNNRIPRHAGVLGGEACMWGEYVNGGGLDTKVWPRAAAVAERLWSDPNLATIDVEPRLQAHKTRLESRGIYADALTPEWCNQHERMCM